LHARVARRAAALDAADAAHVLGDLRIARVLDDAGTGDARAKRLRGVNDDVADAADAHRRVVGDEVFRVVGARARNRDELLLDPSGELRIERAGAGDVKRLRAKIVDRKRRAAGCGDAQRLRFDLRRTQLHVAGQVDDVERPEAQRDVRIAGRTAAEEPAPPATPILGTQS